MAAKADWEATPFDERAAVFLRAADLLAGPWREKLAAATMLGQSKTVYQAEIDAACELIDFWRFNVAFARQILAQQPISSPRRVEPHRLPAARGLRLRDHPVQLHRDRRQPADRAGADGQHRGVEAVADPDVRGVPAPCSCWRRPGCPPGVINLVTGDGIAVSEVALADPRLAGIHFTGSTGTFQHLWREVGTNIDRYHTYPRLVGETGGKDFVVAHPSARPDVLRTALIRGAFDYQGQKCSAASRAFVPRSVWQRMGDDFLAATEALRYGDVTDLSNFGGAVIDERAFAKNVEAIERAKSAAGGHRRRRRRIRRQRRLLRPADRAVVRRSDRRVVQHRVLRADPVGARLPRLGLRADARRRRRRLQVRADRCGDRRRPRRGAAAQQRLRFAAGNFYVNDKPTGAVVGQQPFGGSRASGTNDKAGSPLNLLRWTSARTIKETFVAATDHTYPHMDGLTSGLCSQQLVRPVILGAARSDRTAPRGEQLPVTRKVVDRFVAGETVPEPWMPLRSCAIRAASSPSTTSVRTPPRSRTPTRRCGPTWLCSMRWVRAAKLPTPRCGRWRCRSSCRPSVRRCRATARRSRWTTPASSASGQGIGAWVTVDAEDHTTTDSTLSIVA